MIPNLVGLHVTRFHSLLSSLVQWAICVHNNFFWKSILQVPDTGTRILDNNKPFWRPNIVCFWIPPTCSKECKYYIFGQYWYTRNVPVFTDTGTFKYLGPEVYFFRFCLFVCLFVLCVCVCGVCVCVCVSLVIFSCFMYWKSYVLSLHSVMTQHTYMPTKLFIIDLWLCLFRHELSLIIFLQFSFSLKCWFIIWFYLVYLCKFSFFTLLIAKFKNLCYIYQVYSRGSFLIRLLSR